jgi:poly(A) polymerase
VSAAPATVVREALAGDQAWLVGGAVRDRLLGRHVADVDLVLDGDVRAAARRLARVADGASFPLSEAFGAWRVLAGDRSWRADLTPLRGGTIEADLAERDLTVNAMAEPLAGGPLVDPHGGEADLAARRLRAVGPRAFADDPLRVVRVARLACELGLVPEEGTVALAREQAPAVAEVAAERVFAELKRIVCADGALEGLRLLDALDATRVVLPELAALAGVEQNEYHDRDVHGHTLLVLDRVIAIQRDPGAILGAEHADGVRAVLAEPLADELDRGAALRFGALLHDAAKPATQTLRADGRLGFPRHDVVGAQVSRDALARLHASERLRAHVAALALHHLRLGFLVHSQPIDRHDVFDYLTTCEPVEVDVTLLSVADRLATLGRKAQESIERHLALARPLLGEALRWRARGGRPAPLVRGDELARALGLRPGPELGRLLANLSEAQFAGEVSDPQEALSFARRALDASPR